MRENKISGPKSQRFITNLAGAIPHTNIKKSADARSYTRSLIKLNDNTISHIYNSQEVMKIERKLLYMLHKDI